MIQFSKIYQLYFYLYKSHKLSYLHFFAISTHAFIFIIFSTKIVTLKNVKDFYESTRKLSVLDEPSWDLKNNAIIVPLRNNYLGK